MTSPDRARAVPPPRHPARAVAAAAFAFVVTMIGTTLPTPLYGIYQHTIGFGALMTTVVFAVYAFGVMIALLLFGDFSDRFGRRTLLLPGLVLSALSAVAFIAEEGLPLLFVGRLLSGLSAGIFTGTATAAIVELAPEKHRGRAVLIATGANMLGLGCGPLLSGVLAQYAPSPLITVFVVDLVLITVATIGVLLLPETVPRTGRRATLRPRMPQVPAQARPVFVPAAVAGFAGFATLGLFTSVVPSMASQILGLHNLAVSGALVFTVFAGSTAGQVLSRPFDSRAVLPVGCVVLFTGVTAVAACLVVESAGLLAVGAAVAGTGQGMSFRAGFAVVGTQSPPERRAEINSALFLALYVGISLPVIGIGVLEQALGLRSAGLLFSGFVAALCLLCALRLVVRPLPQETVPAGAAESGSGRH
ncbi:MFS transporter [Streptomyces meridianus]|uniref:MFS transporter n=1 Tax=Streptomyces meridianus TaxID=2938945 RepID=A0ABT0XDY6_9ACTN|nr:MFS transporter [Streptomyces meridianus]MCM2579977.1 MFS transporter [Streptomyces meridianus]